MLNLIINKLDLVGLVAILCVYGNGSILYVEHRQLFNIILILAFAALVICDSRASALSKPNFLAFVLISLPILSTIFKFSPLSNLISLASITILTLLVSLLSLDRILQILNRYAEITFFLIIVSIVFSVMFYTIPAIKNLPVTDNSSGTYYDLLIYTHRYWEFYRVQGIFWEPGVWAINQAFACFWFMYYKKSYKLYPIFFFSFVLTMSTTGLILLLIITAAMIHGTYSTFKINYRIKYILYPFLLLLALVSIMIVKLDIDISRFAYNYTIGKFVAGHESSESHEERLATTKNALEIANNNILLGNGKTAHLYVTSTIADVLYQFGYPYTILYFISCWQLFRRIGFIFSVPFIMVMLNGEVLSYFSLYTLLIILGTKMMLIRNKSELFKRIEGVFSATSSNKISIDGLSDCSPTLKHRALS